MNIPKYLLSAPQGWVDPHGLKRAAKVCKVEATRLRKAGHIAEAKAVAAVGEAFGLAAQKDGFRVAESVTLRWSSES